VASEAAGRRPPSLDAAVLFNPVAGRRGLEMVTRSGGEMRETEKGEDKVGEEWLGCECGFNVVTHVSTAKMVSTYHGVYSFVFACL
jgi:hypothetical protein